MQKRQHNNLQKRFESYCNTIPVFGFNSARCDINLIKSYLIPFLVKERDFEPIAIKKARQILSIEFGNVQLRDILSLLGGVTNLVSFLKAYNTSEMKRFFQTNGSTTKSTEQERTFSLRSLANEKNHDIATLPEKSI